VEFGMTSLKTCARLSGQTSPRICINLVMYDKMHLL
jgi:hypothetical protein